MARERTPPKVGQLIDASKIAVAPPRSGGGVRPSTGSGPIGARDPRFNLFHPAFTINQDRSAITGPVTHATTGALTGQGSTIAGTSAHIAKHTTTGALTGAGSTIVGSSVHKLLHPTSGVLTGAGSTVSGSAARFRAMATSGVLIGQGSTVVGAADHIPLTGTTHDTSGDLVGAGSTVSGSAQGPSHIPMGGAGHPTVYWGVKKHKKWKRNLDWLLDRVVSDYYGELTQPTVPISVRKEAKQIVKPYVEQKQVNWSKFEGDLDRVIKLLELYQHLQDIEDDDETWLMMH